MVKDRKATLAHAPDFYALKVQKSAEHYTEAATDEVQLLQCVATERAKVEAQYATGDAAKEQMVRHAHFVATLHESFIHTGVNGDHMCMVFSMLGCNLLSVIKAYNYRGIPPAVVKCMIRGVCQGLDFLHRQCSIIHTDLKPENVLLQFPHQFQHESMDTNDTTTTAAQVDGLVAGMASLVVQDDTKPPSHSRRSIQHMETLLAGNDLTPKERQKLRRRLKKKRQKEKKRGQENDDDSLEDDDADDSCVDDSETRELGPSMLSNVELGEILHRNATLPLTTVTEPTDETVQRKLGHGMFVSTNFGPTQTNVDSKLMKRMQHKVEITCPTADELLQSFAESEVNGGMAKVSIVMKAASSKEELVSLVSHVLGDVACEPSGTNGSREWRVSLTFPAEGLNAAQRTDESCNIQTSFLLQEVGNDDASIVFDDLVTLVGDNLKDSLPLEEPELAQNAPTKTSEMLSLFAVKFPAKSTCIVLGFLESRLPGVCFMTYKRDEGQPPLDNILFGSNATTVCDHPLAMRIKTKVDSNECSFGSCIFGFDLRLIADYKPNLAADASGEPELSLNCPKTQPWWEGRKSIQDRVKSFIGLDLTSDMITLINSADEGRESRRTSVEADADFREGQKGPPSADATDVSTAPSSRDTSASSAARNASQQPDIKDPEVLLKCRTVIVDLGNACWTHRHFSEDIQTRQYRAPEVIIGSRYDTSADMWSLGCMTFELLTGDLLFDPRAGDDYDRDEDHLAMFQELLGKMPKRLAVEGKYSKNFFDKQGKLKRIKQLKYWPMEEVLMEKYHFSKEDAEGIKDFIEPCLDFDPRTRRTALDAIKCAWLKEC
jgi:serine/threonine protein kinase